MDDFFTRMQEHAVKSQHERDLLLNQIKQETPFAPSLYRKSEPKRLNQKEFLDRQAKFEQTRAEKQ
jgi:hypothetical protein